MAEALVNHDLAGQFEAFSAGTESSFVNPLAMVVMKSSISIFHANAPKDWMNLPARNLIMSSLYAARRMRPARFFLVERKRSIWDSRIQRQRPAVKRGKLPPFEK